MGDNALENDINRLRELEDAVSILSGIFHEIFRVNLSDDTYNLINMRDGCDCNGGESKKTHFSDYIRNLCDTGLLYEEDVIRFLEFVNLERVKEIVSHNKSACSMRFRKKIEEEFRWVEMMIIPAKSFTPDNQIVLFCIKDINEEVILYEKMYQNMVADAIIDLTDDKCCWLKMGQIVSSVNESIKKISDCIIDEDDKERFNKVFNREELIRMFERQDIFQSMEVSTIGLISDTYISKERIYVKMSKNINTNHIEAEMYIQDITKEYINEKLPQMLYDREFVSVGFIQVKNNILYIMKFDKGEQTDIFSGGNRCNFDEFINEKMINDIGDNDRKKFIEHSSVKRIVEVLGKQDIYEFGINDVHGKYKRIKYQWFNEKEEIILCTVEDLSAMTQKDVLTGELNMTGFFNHVSELLEDNRKLDNPQKYIMIYFDIMNFKAVNELFGFEGGDRVLRSIPGIIRESNLYVKIISRFAGDQFVCIVNEKDFDIDKVTKLCEIVHEDKGKKIVLYQRCGIYYINDDTVPVRVMSDHAKLALANVENVLVKPYEIYDDKMGEKYLDRSELISEVKRAFDNNEFLAYYQPIFDPKTNEIVSAEALVRWNHPKRGMISPALFIPALEELGIISSVDMFVAGEVKKLLEERNKNGRKIVPVSVNLSRMDFYDSKVMEEIKNSLEKTTLDRNLFRYEVTESSYMTLTENNIESLNDIRDYGALILIDDFGSGYSSFGTITDYDFDIIKIDMEFVRKIGKNNKVGSVIHSLIDMIHHMGAKVVAEGAETEHQVDFLRRHGCDFIQGYFYSRPLPKEDFIKMLDEE